MNSLQQLYIKANWFEGKHPDFENRIIESLKKVDIGENFTPAEGSIFKAFELTKFKDIKVVILGQDPYPKKGVAIGLAFAVSENTKMPSSLKNIFEVAKINSETADKSLVGWGKQGVLLLNTALTTKVGQRKAHVSQWKPFIEAVIDCLKTRIGIKFFLWGGEAQRQISGSKNMVLCCSHPSPLSWKRTSTSFEKCTHFSETLNIIDWQKTKQ